MLAWQGNKLHKKATVKSRIDGGNGHWKRAMKGCYIDLKGQETQPDRRILQKVMEAKNDQQRGKAMRHRATPKEYRAYSTWISLLKWFSPLECWSCAGLRPLVQFSAPGILYIWLRGREVTLKYPERNLGLPMHWHTVQRE